MLIVANWKMNLNLKEAEALAIEFINLLTPKNEVVIAPPFTHLERVADTLSKSRIKLSAQNCYFEDEGAYTGEISPRTLKEMGCSYVILGHSERRTLFAETNEDVCKKAEAVKKNSMKPIICIGETLEERESGKTNDVLTLQLKNSIPSDFTAEDYVLAYEPVWAIGTGKVASLNDIEDAHAHITSIVGQGVRILYGGSVNDSNCKEIANVSLVGGMLVGGASLSSDSFPSVMTV